MQIQKINIYQVSIPFSYSIDHHLKNRSTTDALVLELVDAIGHTGFGEGAPRKYVTGEDSDQLIKTFNTIADQWIGQDINNLGDIHKIVNTLIDNYQMPAFACAMEMALIDLWAQNNHQNYAQLLGMSRGDMTPYSAIMPFTSPDALEQKLMQIKAWGFPHVKIKVGGTEDMHTIKKAREILGDAVDIRVDANQAWNYEEARKKIEAFTKFNVSGVEEPLHISALNKLGALSNEISLPIILDESIYTLEHAEKWSSIIDYEKLIFNLKLSKCGGLQKAHDIYQYAKTRNIECMLGCNVGETAILTLMGRLFAQRHLLKYLEGAYAPFFMEDDLGVNMIGFEPGGVVQNYDSEKLICRQISKEKLNKYVHKKYKIKQSVDLAL